MRYPATLLLLLLLFPAQRGEAQDTMRIGRYYVVAPQVGLLQWNALPGTSSYSLYRHFHDQTGYTLCATVADTQ